jgi:hypothetical protein
VSINLGIEIMIPPGRDAAIALPAGESGGDVPWTGSERRSADPGSRVTIRVASRPASGQIAAAMQTDAWIRFGNVLALKIGSI